MRSVRGRDSIHLSRWLLAVALAALAAATPAVAASPKVTVIASSSEQIYAAQAWQDRVIWSTAADSLYTVGSSGAPERVLLTASAETGKPNFLDFDIGPGPYGAPAVVYPRCKKPYRGCDIYMYDFASARERRLTATADCETNPSIWKFEIVFARSRHGCGGRLHLLWIGKKTAHRIAGSTTPVGSDRSPHSADFSGANVTYLDRRGMRLLASHGRGRPRLLQRSQAGSVRMTAPSIANRYAYWASGEPEDGLYVINRYNLATSAYQAIQGGVLFNTEFSSAFVFNGKLTYSTDLFPGTIEQVDVPIRWRKNRGLFTKV